MEVKILTYLEVSDLDYLDKIYDGLFISTKKVPKNDIVPQHYVRKTKREMAPKEKNELRSDAKVKNILHNSLDTIMSNWIITFKKHRKYGIHSRFNVKEQS